MHIQLNTVKNIGNKLKTLSWAKLNDTLSRDIRIGIVTGVAAVCLFNIAAIHINSKSLVIRPIVSLPVLVPPGYNQEENKTNKCYAERCQKISKTKIGDWGGSLRYGRFHRGS